MNAATYYRLSDEEIATYHEDGLLIPKHYRLSDHVLEHIRDVYEKALANVPDIDPNFVPSPHIPDFVPGLADSADWLEFAKVPEILDMVGQLIGPDFLLWGSAIFGKPAHQGKATPWHQDGQYWPIKPLASCTVWIALDDAGPENGCLRYVPGSHSAKTIAKHRNDESPELTLNQVAENEAYAEANGRDVILQAGQISIHDIYIMHGSHANHSAKRRAGLTYRYMPTTSHFDHAYAAEMIQSRTSKTDLSRRPLFMMRGVDRCGLNDFTIGHDN